MCAGKLSFIMTFHLHIINTSSHDSDREVAYQQFPQVAEMFHKVFSDVLRSSGPNEVQLCESKSGHRGKVGAYSLHKTQDYAGSFLCRKGHPHL